MPAKTPGAPEDPLRLLVVDDRRDVSVLLKALLSREGHAVSLAEDGPTALEAARELLPHAVVADIALAGTMNGYDVARAIRAESLTPRPRLIALTGFDDEEHRAAAVDAGFDDYLVKPPAISDVLAILAKIAR